MRTLTVLFTLLLFSNNYLNAQACTPLGDEATYGNADTWIGYVYDNADFTNYHGYVNEGASGNANFDESFGGDDVNYATNGCPVFTSTYSVRYKLRKTFSSGMYDFMVGADDGYRLSLDGGATWVINQWNDQSYMMTTYSTMLNGTYDMVLEYYENGGGNRVSFSVSGGCVVTGDESLYGTGNVWRGYIYSGQNFNTYKGLVTEGNAGNSAFDESFGGSAVSYVTDQCSQITENFSARYRLTKNFLPGTYLFTVGGDDGYRLSLDGGATWVIDKWFDQGYNITSYSANLNGSYNMVIEFYENGGGNEISFNMNSILLPVTFISFNAARSGETVTLNWATATEVNNDHFDIERSANGTDFTRIATVSQGGLNASGNRSYRFVDEHPLQTRSYYRLRQVDKDGRSTYSKVVPLNIASAKLTIAPNPVVGGRFIITPKSNESIRGVEFYDASGRLLHKEQVSGAIEGMPVTVKPGSTMSQGFYMLRIITSLSVQQQSIWWTN